MILYYFVNHTHGEIAEVPQDTYELLAHRLRIVCRVFPKWNLWQDEISLYDTERDMDRILQCKDRGYTVITPNRASDRV